MYAYEDITVFTNDVNITHPLISYQDEIQERVTGRRLNKYINQLKIYMFRRKQHVKLAA